MYRCLTVYHRVLFSFPILAISGIIATYLDFRNFLVCISPINIRFGSGLPLYLLILTFLPTVFVLIGHLSSNKTEFTLELRLLFSSSVPFSRDFCNFSEQSTSLSLSNERPKSFSSLTLSSSILLSLLPADGVDGIAVAKEEEVEERKKIGDKMESDSIGPGEKSGVEDIEEFKSSNRGKGTWKHAAFHVATTIATPAAYAPLPFALASLGWPIGVCILVSGTLTTWYSSLLIASLWEWNGEKHTTYRELGKSIFGSWGYWSITFFQQVASIGNNIAIHIAAGTSLKAVYKYYHRDGTMTLQKFIIFFGAFELLLSQLPDIHSLRWVNALCTGSTIGFAGTTIGVAIYNGTKIDRKSINYRLEGRSSFKIFKAFNALGTIAFSFGDAMLPEIQSTVREPAKKNMYKGISTAYGIIVLSYWQLAFSGYWAFGSEVQPYILSSLVIPEWTIVMANIFAVIQISGCFQIYCRPTYAYVEERLLSKRHSHCHTRNLLVRLVLTSCYMVLIAVVAAAMPFFGDFVSICGAIGFTPLDFVFPALAFLKAGKLPKKTGLRVSVQIINIGIATCFSVVALLGCIGAIRFIIKDVKTYRFFYDM